MLTDDQAAQSLQNLADAAESCEANGLDTSAGDIRAAMAAFRAALDTIREQGEELARLRAAQAEGAEYREWRERFGGPAK